MKCIRTNKSDLASMLVTQVEKGKTTQNVTPQANVFGFGMNTDAIVLGKQKPNDIGKKTLVLDLDETLVHSSFQPTEL
jgi:RNA polymerase II subunit A small phosphatase-like protein